MHESNHSRVTEGPAIWSSSGRPGSGPPADVEGQITLLPRALIRERMTELRRQTAPEHARLDEQIASSGWLRSVDGYRQLLGRFYEYYRPLESVLREAVRRFDLPIDVEARQKSHLIARDLAALGVSADGVRSMPGAQALPRIESREAALGCLYVVEGATLGGQMIAHRLRQQFGAPVETAVAFFSSYGTDVGERWLAFCSLLATALAHPESEQAIAASAATMFNGFGQWLREGDAPA